MLVQKPILVLVDIRNHSSSVARHSKRQGRKRPKSLRRDDGHTFNLGKENVVCQKTNLSSHIPRSVILNVTSRDFQVSVYTAAIMRSSHKSKDRLITIGGLEIR